MERRSGLYTSSNGAEAIIGNNVSPKSERLHPDHYAWFREKFGVDLMDVVAEFNFNRGNAIKYIMRAGHKQENGIDCVDKEIEDLNKAIIYLIHEVKRLEVTKFTNQKNASV
jgi:uncharacterized protein YfeS